MSARQLYLLPDGYDPNADYGRRAVELFLDDFDGDEPPTHFNVEQISATQWAVAVTFAERSSEAASTATESGNA